MSVQASSWVIEHSKHKGSALLVMLMIANHAHADGTNAFPSIPTLARECRMSARQISRIIDHLEASGELNVERSGGRLSHRYSLPFVQPGQVVPSDNHDIVSALNNDKMSTLADATRTFRAPNHDISAPNVDIAVSPEPSVEPSREPSEEKKVGESANASPQTSNISSAKVRTSPKTPPDPRSNHPAIQLVKKLMSRYPDKIWYDEIIETVGEEPDVGRLTACRKEWIGRGWNSNSLDWIAWYANGIPERNGNGINPRNQHPGSTRSAPKRSLADAAREHAEHFGGLRVTVGDARKDSVR